MTGKPLLEVVELEKHYRNREGPLGRRQRWIRAVDGINFAIESGATLGLVGESGCGKSTVASAILGLTEPTAGTVRFDGTRVEMMTDTQRRAFRRRVSIIFQNPSSSFDPKLTIGESVAEPMRIQGVADPARRRTVVLELLGRCGLAESVADRRPHELSDGQKQRAALARALVLDPDLLVADEPVSALDMSIQAEILTLLNDIRDELDIAMLVISHDMDVVAELCDRLCVMYLGEIVERGPTEALLEAPDHPYSRALVSSVAVPDPRQADTREPLAGEIPDPASPPAGCRFHPRCPSIIPPNELDITAETYRGIIDLRAALEAGELEMVSARELDEVDDEPSAADRDASRRRLRLAHGLPRTIEDSDAERAVDRALTAAIEGNAARGAELLHESFESDCERFDPELRSVEDDRVVACHRYPDEDDTAYDRPGDVD